MREYELMYIIRPSLNDEEIDQANKSVKSLIENYGGTITSSTSWGKRRLAYEVQHLRDGYYMLAQLELDGSKISEVERALRIHDQVFRYLLTTLPAGAPRGGDLAATVPETATLPPPEVQDLDIEIEVEEETAAEFDDAVPAFVEEDEEGT